MPDQPPFAPVGGPLLQRLVRSLAFRQAHSPLIHLGLILLLIAGIALIDHSASARMTFKFFYLLPLAIAVARLGLAAGIVVAIIASGFRTGGDFILRDTAITGITLWNWSTDLMMFLLFAWMLHGLLELSRNLESRVEARTRELREANRLRRQLENELLDVAAREQRNIGQELHDSVCQRLVGTAFATKVLSERLARQDPESSGHARNIVRHIEDSIDDTRRLAKGLLLEKISPSELPEALTNLAALTAAAGVPCKFLQEGSLRLQDDLTSSHLLRIAQEAVRNAARHSRASRVEIVLSGDPDSPSLVIRDNGCGMPPKSSRGRGMGIQIMEYRTSRIGGILSIIPNTPSGTMVICRLPGKTNPT